MPTLQVTLGYVRACGGDTAEWEKRWRALRDELRPAPITPPSVTAPGEPPAVPATVPAGRAHRAPAAAHMDAAALKNVNNHGVVEPVRRQGTIAMSPGNVIDVNSMSPDWGLGKAPSHSPEDLEFTLAHHTLEGIDPAELGVLPRTATGDRRECGSLQAYGVSVEPAQMRPGLIMCEIADTRRDALLRITAMHHDPLGEPDRLTLDITVWESEDAQ